MSRCCHESGCRRTQPIFVRLAPFSRRWMVITKHRELDTGHIVASQKHDVDADLRAELIRQGWMPPETQE